MEEPGRADKQRWSRQARKPYNERTIEMSEKQPGDVGTMEKQ
jgi:hypothetical protein